MLPILFFVILFAAELVVPKSTEDILFDLASQKFALKKQYCMLYEQGSLLGDEAQALFNKMASNRSLFCISSFEGTCRGEDLFEDLESIVEYKKSLDVLNEMALELRKMHYSSFLDLSNLDENNWIFKLDSIFYDCLITSEEDDEYDDFFLI